MLTQSNFIRACLFGGAILVLTTVLEAQSKSNIEFRPKIPKAWDDAEVAAMEIPLAAPAPPVTNISASYYYSIPPVTIYKTYPFLSSEPFAEYWKWLKQRKPEVAFDLAKLKTKADWEKFGEFVFSLSPHQDYFAPPKQALDAAAKGRGFAFVAPEGPVAPEWVIREKGKVEMIRKLRRPSSRAASWPRPVRPHTTIWRAGGVVAVFPLPGSGLPRWAKRCLRSNWRARRPGCSVPTPATRVNFHLAVRSACSPASTNT